MLRFACGSIGMTIGALVISACASTNSANCPMGQYYDPNMGRCTMQGGMCPPGQVLGQQGCVMQQGCPPGQMFNGQQCVVQQSPCPPGQQWNGATCVQGGGFGGMGGAACTPAQPLDPTSAAAVTQTLPFLGAQHAPGATPVGGALSGNFQPGQCLEMQVTLAPGKCYTAVGTGAGPQEVDVQLVASLPSPVPIPPFAQDNSTGPQAVMGGSPNCFRNPGPLPVPVKLVLKVTAGQGLAAAQLYEK